MVHRRLLTYHLQNPLDNIVLAIEFDIFNSKEIEKLFTPYVKKIEIEDGEHIIITNKDKSVFTCALGDMIILTNNKDKVINMNKRVFNYLYKGV